MNAPTATHRWRGVVALTLFAGSVGILAQQPEVLLLATVGVGYAAYSRVSPSAPEPDLTVDRTVSPARPSEGDDVEVQTVVRNDGERRLPDLRLVDGVPSLLPVVDGTPRRATALGPGDETTIEYTVEATDGKHRFQPMTVLSRDVAGAGERRTTVRESTVVDCGVPVSSAALRNVTRQRAGQLRTDEGGNGIEFHRAREYRQGDPMRRVDWNRFAKGGELSTIEFREERSAAVVLCVDPGTPTATDVGAGTATRHAVALSVAAAERVANALAADNHEIGLSSLGPEFHWLPPRAGKGHLDRIRETLDTHEAFAPAAHDAGSSVPPDGGDPTVGIENAGNGGLFDLFGPGDASTAPVSDGGRPVNGESDGRRRQTARLRERLGSDTQVMLFSPLADDDIVDAVRTLEAGNTRVTVVSPDETAEETLGNRLAGAERTTRVQALRRGGVPVVDWQRETDLGHALATTMERQP